MIITIDIDITNSKALALLNYIRTLDFIKIKEKEVVEEYELNSEQINIINERRKKHFSGESKSFSWEEVKKELKR